MPTVLRVNGYRFYWYSREDGEPIHIHIRKDDCKAKFWIQPLRLAKNEGFADHELNQIRTVIEENLALIKEAWNEEK